MLDPVFLRRSDEGEICLYDKRDKFVACFKAGSWQNKLLFNDYELEEFTIIEDENEIVQVLAEARAALSCPLKDASDNRAKSA